MSNHDALVGQIYDCAANPELWPDTLTAIRDALGTSYVLVGYADFSPLIFGQPVSAVSRYSAWDEGWMARLPGLLDKVPGGDALTHGGIDRAWTQLRQMPEEDVRRSEFYQAWAGPQKLRDCMNVLYISRQRIFGMLSAATPDGKPPIDEAQCRLGEFLSPHIRRAMAINDMVDKGRLALALYRKVLDSLSVAVFVTGIGRRLVFANAAGEALLSDGKLVRLASGALSAARGGISATALDEAIDRASKGNEALGIKGIGVPLAGDGDERAAAYVLPISGNDLRGALGQGHAAVFIARRGEQQPVETEILRTVFDLTQMQARVAAMVASGESPARIAETLGISINTVRTHLAQCYARCGVADQTALAATVNGLVPPVIVN